MTLTPDVVVVGGGVIGLAIAWQAADAGLAVVLVDPSPGAGASHVAAGMLAPVTEVSLGEQPLLGLTLASAQRWPGFAERVEAASGQSVGYRRDGTLAVALDADDRAELAALHDVQTRLGLAAQLLTSRETRRLEPMLAPSVRGGLLVPGDHSVDNRRLSTALQTAAERSGVRFVAARAERVLTGPDGGVVGVGLSGVDVIKAGTTVLAAGAWSAGLAGLRPEVLPAVRPVKGQILRLRGPAVLTHSVRAVVRGSHVYLVPRADGELVVGATMEEQGEDTRVTAGGAWTLLRDALLLAPALAELELTEARAGLRPGTPDNAPLLGPAGVDGLVVATGHHRNGVLLAPVTADAITSLLVSGVLPEIAAAFVPGRFSRAEVSACR